MSTENDLVDWDFTEGGQYIVTNLFAYTWDSTSPLGGNKIT